MSEGYNELCWRPVRIVTVKMRQETPVRVQPEDEKRFIFVVVLAQAWGASPRASHAKISTVLAPVLWRSDNAWPDHATAEPEPVSCCGFALHPRSSNPKSNANRRGGAKRQDDRTFCRFAPT